MLATSARAGRPLRRRLWHQTTTTTTTTKASATALWSQNIWEGAYAAAWQDPTMRLIQCRMLTTSSQKSGQIGFRCHVRAPYNELIHSINNYNNSSNYDRQSSPRLSYGVGPNLCGRREGEGFCRKLYFGESLLFVSVFFVRRKCVCLPLDLERKKKRNE